MNGFALSAFLQGLPLTAAAVAVVLAVTFAMALRLGRHSVVDVAWGLGFAAVALVSAVLSAGEGDAARRVLVAGMTILWGVRLAAYIGWRQRGAPEDPRYAALLDRAPGNRTRYVLRSVYLTQGVALWVVSLPVQVAMYQRGSLGLPAMAGAVLWAVGLLFEAIGDAQLARFKADPANKNPFQNEAIDQLRPSEKGHFEKGSKATVMDRGLWRYTRHPNYFGDACVWWGLFLVACEHWPGVLTVFSPLLMTYFLVKATGKALLERHLSQTRPGYADYVARTSGFIPLPPRRTR